MTSPVDGEVRHRTRAPSSATRSANSASVRAPAAAAWTIRRKVSRGASGRLFRRAFSDSARDGLFAAVRSGLGAARSRYFFRSAGSPVHPAASAHRRTSPRMIRSRDSLARPPSCRARVAIMCTWLSPWQTATHRTPRCSRPRRDSPVRCMNSAAMAAIARSGRSGSPGAARHMTWNTGSSGARSPSSARGCSSSPASRVTSGLPRASRGGSSRDGSPFHAPTILGLTCSFFLPGPRR